MANTFLGLLCFFESCLFYFTLFFGLAVSVCSWSYLFSVRHTWCRVWARCPQGSATGLKMSTEVTHQRWLFLNNHLGCFRRPRCTVTKPGNVIPELPDYILSGCLHGSLSAPGSFASPVDGLNDVRCLCRGHIGKV